jgi:hypothetical protein
MSPVYEQDEETPESLLIQLDEEDLSSRSKQRLEPFFSEDLVDYETLRANIGIDPKKQIALARELMSNPAKYTRILRWTGMPSWQQLSGVCELMWTFFEGAALASRSVSSSNQLAFLVNDLRRTPSVKDIIGPQIAYLGNVDRAVEKTLDFLRLWANFHFPKLLRAIDRIQKDVFKRLRQPAGDYAFYAASVENFFLDSALVALEEYGIPIQVSLKLKRHLEPEGDVDAVLERVRALPITEIPLTLFERRLVQATQDSL